jgi:2-polyprenyl-3-methyl-5-hydroxy-6-metoxy-1,4-benzoquinol methylase
VLKTRREAALRPALLRIVNQRTTLSTTIEFPALPGLADIVVKKVVDLVEIYGREFSSNELALLRSQIVRAVNEGYESSSDARLVVELTAPHGKTVTYKLGIRHLTLEDRYKSLASVRPPPLFGKLPDAMVTNTAATLGPAGAVRVLDVGAGTGRNAIALARRGHPVHAVEMVAQFAEEIRATARSENLPITVVEKDFLGPDVPLGAGAFQLAVIAEVLTHFRTPDDVRAAFQRFSELLAPGGVVVANVFVTRPSYKPEALAKQVGLMSWSSFFTPQDLASIMETLPFETIAEHPVLAYEKARIPPEDWPPTKWFETWANGQNAFDMEAGMSPPIELRWLVFRRR